MEVAASLLDLVGNTPLVAMPRFSAAVPPTLLGKVEYLNPGGSVKDRIGLAMVEAAEQAGLLRPGRHDRRADQRQHRARAWRSWRCSAATAACS